MIKNRSFRSRLNEFTDFAFVIPTLLFVAIFQVYPVIYNILLSFRGITMQNFRSGGDFVGLQNYAAILSDPDFTTALLTSLIFTISCMTGDLIIGFSLALLFKRKFPLAGVLRGMFLIVWMLPAVVSGTLMRWILAPDTGILNYALKTLGFIQDNIAFLSTESTALPSVIGSNIWCGTPFYFIMLLSGLTSLPDECYEAAKIDGASPFQAFRCITLPLMKPKILVLLMLGFMYSFKVFDLLYVMTGGGPIRATTVAPIYIFEKSFMQFKFGIGGAASCVMLLVISVLAVFYLIQMRKEENL